MTVYCSVDDGMLTANQELAEWHGKYFTIKADNVEDLTTPENYYIRLVDIDFVTLCIFIHKFFPNGLPYFSVELLPQQRSGRYFDNIIRVNNEKVGQLCLPLAKSGRILEKNLNWTYYLEKEEEE